ncbi:unnamed protein product [Effrenium voratum]|uniref:Zinc finger RING-type eukaryotic domain-containing protein n=1 Tax=Effrenium voratum TaxID=2562239 RepID=A0AA36HWZ8_9DINO|nr:unnamed protein product [Effrenium voratum]
MDAVFPLIFNASLSATPVHQRLSLAATLTSTMLKQRQGTAPSRDLAGRCAEEVQRLEQSKAQARPLACALSAAMSFVQQLATQSQAAQQVSAEAFKAKCMEVSRTGEAQLELVGFSSLEVNCWWHDQSHIEASWDGVKAAPAPKHHAPAGGVSETCGICQERAPLTALAPCGHTMCRGCLAARAAGVPLLPAAAALQQILEEKVQDLATKQLQSRQ